MNKFEIDLNIYKKCAGDISFPDFCMLTAIVEDILISEISEIDKEDYTEYLHLLEEKLYIKLGEKIELRQKTILLFDLSNNKVEDWIEEWREIFPEGSNENGFRYRGDKGECLSKMKRFVKVHKNITKEEIFNATKLYVSKFSQQGFKFMSQAHYFIHKQGSGSLLEQYITMADHTEYPLTPNDSNPFIERA